MPWDDSERAELTTRLARAIGLQARFDEAAALLIELDGKAPVVGVRAPHASGRLMNSSGHPDAAAVLFRRTATIAHRTGMLFLRVDALHMLAIVDPDGTELWTAQAPPSRRSHPIHEPVAGSSRFITTSACFGSRRLTPRSLWSPSSRDPAGPPLSAPMTSAPGPPK